MTDVGPTVIYREQLLTRWISNITIADVREMSVKE